jgi:hypothetical protein
VAVAGMSDGHIDVHSHFLPDCYREAATAAGHAQPDGIAELPVWTAAGHVAVMDRRGIATGSWSARGHTIAFITGCCPTLTNSPPEWSRPRRLPPPGI